jgi:hypothetical protein
VRYRDLRSRTAINICEEIFQNLFDGWEFERASKIPKKTLYTGV